MLLGKMDKLIIHLVGNKNNGDGARFSKALTNFENIEDYLKNLISNSFKSDEFYNFYFSPNIDLNPIYQFASTIFNDEDSFIDQSQNCSRHLYDKSIHPKIKSGEFYVSYFKDCILDGKTVDALGLFKSENKDTYLKVYPKGDRYEIESEKGLNINKLDKGCLIFNIEKENGYVVAIVDNTNKGEEAQYWRNDFLHVQPRKDEYYNTQNILSLCKEFVTKGISQQFEVTKADQVDFLNRSVTFFKERESFEMADFVNKVINKPEIIECFNQYKTNFQEEREIKIVDSFNISNSAVKRQARAIKSIIKLDKNFHIYVHGSRELIEQGIDETGRKFYKIYYKEES